MGSIVERPLRDALRMIVPGPVVLISSMSKGQPIVMTAAWLTARRSHRPLSVLPFTRTA